MKIRIIIFFSILIQICLLANPDSLINKLQKTNGKDRIIILLDLMEMLRKRDPEAALKYGREVEKLLQNFPDNELKLRLLDNTGWAFLYSDKIDSAEIYADKAGKLASEIENNKGFALENLLKARIARTEGEFQDALRFLDNAIKYCEEDNILKAKILNETGSVLRRLSDYSEALKNHQQAYEILKNTNDDELIVTYTYLGIVHDILGNYDEALKNHQIALELNRKKPDKQGIAASLHNIGILYQKIQNYERSLDYYNQALILWEELNNSNALASTLNSLGAVNELLTNYDKALNYYRQALSIWEKSGSRYSVSIALNNIGSIYEYLGNYPEAEKYLTQAISIRKKLGDKNGTAGSLLVLASVYNKQGNVNSAVSSALEGLNLAEETGSWSTIREAHDILSEIYESNGYYKEALLQYKKFKAAHDSMFNSESREIIEELEAKYKSDEQQRQIELLQREQEIQNLYRTLLIAGLIVTVIILILLFNRYRLKKRAHETSEKLHKSEIETEKARAAMIQLEYEQKKKELDAARDLQLSMLPSQLPEHPHLEIAAHMQTATEVGGDYYDFHLDNNGRLTMVIGDATGHGAQAGTIVTATKSLFNLLARNENIADILNHINYSIRKMRIPNLFMAMGIVRYYNGILELAGAGMPPALLHSTDDGKLQVVSLKGLPLGSMSDFEYSATAVQLKPGDTIALMSDGFPELFNEKDEMLGYDTVIKIFEKYAVEPPRIIIDKLIEEGSRWLNGTRQQDDMTFIVFRVR